MKGKIENLHPNLVEKLRFLETALGFELEVVSGQRTTEHNADPLVGGVENSEHTYDPAEGADVLCLRSVTRFKMVKTLIMMGVQRIGIGATFIHVGIAKDPSKPQGVLWHYYPKPKPGSVEV